MIRSRTSVSLMALAALVGCSSNTGPNDPVQGTWHVAVVGMTNTFSPTSFTITVGKAGSLYTSPLPAMTYNGVALDSTGSDDFGTQTKDSVMAYGTLVQLVGDTLVGARVGRGAAGCKIALVVAHFNSKRDSITGFVFMLDSSAGFSECDAATVLATKG
ncbi:MAG TPA: hypothetical protein VMC86_13270 [Gemmatimonadales bacterium]|nr:hypothetical protein [Gemmatimonadales bacterium]